MYSIVYDFILNYLIGDSAQVELASCLSYATIIMFYCVLVAMVVYFFKLFLNLFKW